MTQILLGPVLVLLIVLLVAIVSLRSAKRSLAATVAWCDAGDAFEEWVDRNPGVYIGLSPEGRQHVWRLIDTYDEFCASHSFHDGAEHRRFYLSLFDHLPPDDRPPKRRGLRSLPAPPTHGGDIFVLIFQVEGRTR